ncbi:helicase [[Flexibacter] sp. ATCC 35208]|nr:helicase [[Flexibacter] sp. ATCC 35208]
MSISKKQPTARKRVNKKKQALPLHVSHTRKPDNLTDKEWQTILRRQIAEKETFTIENLDQEPIYSNYRVFSAKSGNTYKVALRSKDNSLNFCSCLDFKTNQLGTCKHIEAVRLFAGKKRGMKKLLDVLPVLSYSSMYVSYTGEQKVKLRIGTEGEKKFKNWSRKYFDRDNTLLPAAYFDIEQLLLEAHKINAQFRCYDDALQLIIKYREKHNRKALLEEKGAQLLKDLVNVSLFPYQQEGILFATRAGRSILADDMGLGKTVQGIAWAMLLQQNLNTDKVLIICPTSLKYQWKTEIEKFTGRSVTVIEGNALTRRALYENDENYFMIVSYHMAGNDWHYINQMNPDAVILDEAQRIKNWKAKISQHIKRIQSPYALILTGTPLENNIEELYSLVQYIDPFQLGSLHHFLRKHQLTDTDTGKVTGYKGLNEIGKQLADIVLRRTKKEVLKQLPGRMDKTLFVPLTPPQQDLHKEYADAVAQLVNKWKRFGFLNEQDRQRMLNYLNLMRMVCDSTYIIDQKTNHQTKLDELFNILDELFLIEDEKVVIFSQWERMTRLIAERLKERGVKFENLHGGVPSKRRESLFENFNNDAQCKVFLSTDAGGVGLNLQAASYLINMDIPWNPAVLEQRIARIYRMGQKKNVSIINLVAQETIEHRMLSVLKFKSAVAAGVLDNGEDCIFLGDDKFKQFMQSVETLTQEISQTITSFDTQEQEEITTQYNKTEKDADDNNMIERLENESLQQPASKIMTTDDPREETAATIVQHGMNFFTQLINTLSNQDAVEKLTATITETDQTTGQTYLKLPIESKQTVEKALHLLSGLFKAFDK